LLRHKAATPCSYGYRHSLKEELRNKIWEQPMAKLNDKLGMLVPFGLKEADLKRDLEKI
jgi:hypothetical protein